MKKLKKLYCGFSFAFGTLMLVLALVLCFQQSVYATGTVSTGQTANTTNSANDGAIDTNAEKNAGLHIDYDNSEGSLSGNIKLLLVLTVISLAPSILIMLTSFTRIIIVLHFLRTAIGTQTAPPNQVLIGLSLFLTLFIMNPVFTEINETAIKPLDAGEITQEEALEIGTVPLREFMEAHTQEKDLAVFCDIAGLEVDFSNDEEIASVPMYVLIPSFIISELRTAFIIGFFIYIPFIVIDMVVASVLMSMGMMMLPPTTISMPFKVLLFVLADGWNLVVVDALVRPFY